MRLASITNWAYGITVSLTLLSTATMLVASNAIDEERGVIEQRHRFSRASAELEKEVFILSERARQYVNTGDATYLTLYDAEFARLGTLEQRLKVMEDSRAHPVDLADLHRAVTEVDMLHDEQRAAIDAYRRGDENQARQVLFGPVYERSIERIDLLVGQFQDRLDERFEQSVQAARGTTLFWKAVSEIALAITAMLVMWVLYFVIKRRVVRPVLRLSDVVRRLANQDFAAELPEITQIDEIGDMAQAIAAFRENAIERRRLEEEREQDRGIRDLLSGMSQRLQGCDTLDDLKATVRRFVPEIVPERAGRLYLFDPARNALVEACSWLDPQESGHDFPPTACWALRRGMPHRPRGEQIDLPCDHLRHDVGEIADTVCLPLMAQREILGLLYLEQRSDGRTTSEQHDSYLTMLAENISLALANLRLADRLRELALRDPLTGLANRRHLDHVLHKLATAIVPGEGVPLLACLMIDVDFFKRFNDEYGHDAGDAVLREVASVLQSVTSGASDAFRYGGEEFVILLPGLGLDGAYERAVEIRRRIGDLAISHGGVELGRITVSIGLAVLARYGAGEEVIASADAALLRAKRNGRDRIETAQQRGEARLALARA